MQVNKMAFSLSLMGHLSSATVINGIAFLELDVTDGLFQLNVSDFYDKDNMNLTIKPVEMVVQ